MIKRWLKIIILFILIVSVLIAGWYMYQELGINRHTHHTNMYDYIPGNTLKILNIEKERDLTNYSHTSSFFSEIDFLFHNISYPVIVCKSKQNREVFIFKTTREQEKNIKKRLNEYPYRTIEYKNKHVHIIKFSHDIFFTYTFHNGLFIGSNSYKAIKNVFETSPRNSFFSNKKGADNIENILFAPGSSIFISKQDNIAAFNYNIQADTIKLDGYIFSDSINTSTDIKNLIYKHPIFDSTCIDSIAILPEKNLSKIKIILNKLY